MSIKRLFCVLLVLIMCLSFAPITTQAAGTEDTPTQYIEDISWIVKSKKFSFPLLVKTDESPFSKAFEFDATVPEYDLIVPSVVTAGIKFEVTFSDAAKEDTSVGGKVTNGSTPVYGETAADFKVLTEVATGDAPLCLNNSQEFAVGSSDPCVIRLESGVLTPGDDFKTGTLTEQGTPYVFNIYRSAAMSQFTVTYPNETAAAFTSSYLKNGYVSDFVFENVAAGTQTLNIAGSFTTDFQMTVDNGTGNFVAATADSNGAQYTLDLNAYNSSYWKNDALVIPLILKYTGSGCCLDGYYTLTLTFAEPEPENSEINPHEATFDKNAENDDISVEMTLKSNTLAGILYDGSQLTVGEAYTVEGSTVTLLKSWLKNLPVGDTELTFEFSAGAVQMFTVTVVDTSGTQTSSHYFKRIIIAEDSDYSMIDHEYFTDFDKDQFTYDIGSMPDRGRLPEIYLSLENEEEYGKLQCMLTLSNTDGTILASGSGPFKKLANTYDDDKEAFKAFGLISNTSEFSQFPPGNYSLSVKVFEEGHEDAGEEYVFIFGLVPYLSAFSATSGGKQIVSEPDVAVITEETKSIVLFNREYALTVENTNELSLTILIQSWLDNHTYGDATTAVSLLYNGISIPAHYQRGDKGTTIDATIDFSGCENTNGVYTVQFSLVYGEGINRVTNDYTLYIAVVGDSGWEITDYSDNGTYNKGDVAAISVTVSGEKADNVTYRWQWVELRSFAESGNYRADIENATGPTLIVPTSSSGRRFYRCIVTDKDTGAFQSTDPIIIDVNVGQVNEPLILCQPGEETGAKTEYVWGEPIQPIRVTTGITDMLPQDKLEWAAEISIQWFLNDTNSYENAVLLDDSNYEVTSNSGIKDPVLPSFADRIDAYVFSYTVSETPDIGDYYFYCIITASQKGNSENSASVTSSIVRITVTDRHLIGFEGNGTETDPYLIKTVDDLVAIDGYVMNGDALAGVHFRFANDIVLPTNWEPIGSNNCKFSGILDGNDKTLIYENGARSLLEWTRDAVVRNLKIYGEEINGAGLLEKAGVDYGDDHVYQENDPDIITVENVTLLSGSKTTGSGLVNGGYTSGINNIFIRNCLIQENVVIGCNKDQSDIGSFVGTLNGRIENSTSYATVYGVSDVGGLAGKKGQAMGLCEIINSAFLGTVEASGGRVGGIIGAGYINYTAPNTMPVTVRNCYVIANIKGDSTPVLTFAPGNIAMGFEDVDDFDNGSGIGGIMGSEIGLMSSINDAYICDNYFGGTITDTNPDSNTAYTRVGGILGEIGGYKSNHLFYENNYYLSSHTYSGFGYRIELDEEWEPDAASFIPKPADAFTDGTVLDALNSSDTSYKNWIEGPDGYPVHGDGAYAKELSISGNFKATYYIGETLDMSGAVFTITYSDGTKETVDWTDVEFSGFDMSAQGVYTVTATWGPLSAKFEIRVLLKNPDAITVSFVLYGDTAHGDNGEIHTLDESNLTVWIARAEYEIDENTTVLDVFVAAAEKAGLTWVNDKGNYISSITNGDVTLAELTNGSNSGWMYTLNGVHPKNGVAEQFLTDGDCILFHYTDDYEVETGMTDVAIRSMEMDTTALTVEAGETAELIVSFEPELLNGNVRIDWTSADTGIATVKNGVVTGLSEGETTITAEARDAGFHVTATVTVTPGDNVVQVESVTVSPETLTLTEGETGTLTATVLPENATSKDVQWSSSDETVATVSSKGVVTAVKAGTTVITAAAGGKSATVTITVEAEEIAVTGVTLNKTSVSVTEEETVTLKATVSPSNATNKTVTWLSSDEDVATVDENGVVTGVKPGTATITAQVGTYSATCEVTVNAADKTVKNLKIVDDDNADNFANVTSSVETTVDGEGNKTKTAALTVDSTRINDEGEVEDIPCMVIVKNPDGSYERLEAKANTDGSYTFVKENYSEDMEFFVAVMGDTNLDGKLSIADMLLARAAMLGKVSLDDLAFMVSDLDGVNGLTIADILKARAYSLNMTTLDW